MAGRPLIEDWLRLILGEFEELPGLALTRPEIEVRWGLDSVSAEALLNVLVATGRLRQADDGKYARAEGLGPASLADRTALNRIEEPRARHARP